MHRKGRIRRACRLAKHPPVLTGALYGCLSTARLPRAVFFIVAPACGISTNERCLRRVEGTDVCVLGTRAYLMRIRLSLTVLSMVIVVATVGWLWLLFKVAAYLLGY